MARFTSTRAQAWSMDLIVASMIFIFAILFFYLYLVNKPNEKSNLERMFHDGEIMAANLLSEGYPSDWNSSNVQIIGLTSNGKINDTKLSRFYNLSLSDYSKAKQVFNTNYNYLFLLPENMTIGLEEVSSIGRQPQLEKNLIKVTRFTIYKDRPITAYVYIWE